MRPRVHAAGEQRDVLHTAPSECPAQPCRNREVRSASLGRLCEDNSASKVSDARSFQCRTKLLCRPQAVVARNFPRVAVRIILVNVYRGYVEAHCTGDAPSILLWLRRYAGLEEK